MPDPAHGRTANQGDGVSLSPLAPLSILAYRSLWLIWLITNVSLWMNDVAAAWMMTSMQTSALWVALVQTASTLPMFLLGLPSGALADILDRRRYFILTQCWVAGVALLLCAVVLSGEMTPALLLALTTANGIGLALRFPIFSALVPELVPRPQLPAALALNGVAMNASRIAGPLIAGALIASAGMAWVFVLNAVLSVTSIILLLRWRRTQLPDEFDREGLFSAMRVGVQFVRQSACVKSCLVRTVVFFFHSIAILALLPLVATGYGSGAASIFTLLLACMGCGSLAGALLLPRLRARLRLSNEWLAYSGALTVAVAVAVVAASTSTWVGAPAMFAAGAGWMVTANALTLSVQLALADWVRARGMSIYQMAMMGASAAGAVVWGQLATTTSVQASLLVAGISTALATVLMHLWSRGTSLNEDFTPSMERDTVLTTIAPQPGKVVVMIEYLIDVARAEEFLSVMQESRRSRLRRGALCWELLHDATNPARYVECITDQSWTEHLRCNARISQSDVALREHKSSFHVGPGSPTVDRYFSAAE